MIQIEKPRRINIIYYWKKFAAGRHPKISLMTFEYEEKEIDVIIINPKGYVPYYLEKAETDQKVKKTKQSMQVAFILELKIKIPQ